MVPIAQRGRRREVAGSVNFTVAIAIAAAAIANANAAANANASAAEVCSFLRPQQQRGAEKVDRHRERGARFEFSHRAARRSAPARLVRCRAPARSG
jgi:hypothetical protein